MPEVRPIQVSPEAHKAFMRHKHLLFVSNATQTMQHLLDTAAINKRIISYLKRNHKGILHELQMQGIVSNGKKQR